MKINQGSDLAIYDLANNSSNTWSVNSLNSFLLIILFQSQSKFYDYILYLNISHHCAHNMIANSNTSPSEYHLVSFNLTPCRPSMLTHSRPQWTSDLLTQPPFHCPSMPSSNTFTWLPTCLQSTLHCYNFSFNIYRQLSWWSLSPVLPGFTGYSCLVPFLFPPHLSVF